MLVQFKQRKFPPTKEITDAHAIIKARIFAFFSDTSAASCNGEDLNQNKEPRATNLWSLLAEIHKSFFLIFEFSITLSHPCQGIPRDRSLRVKISASYSAGRGWHLTEIVLMTLSR